MSSRVDLARSLVDLAKDDALALGTLVEAQGIADSVVGFHSQQAVEKSLKAVLAVNDVEFPYTHDLDGLVELCISSGLQVPEGLSGVEALSPFGVQLRYGAFEPPQLDRTQAVRWAALAIGWAAAEVDGFS